MKQYKPMFFQLKEFRCPCCGQGQVAELLVLWLEWFRRAWGEPVIVNSGWRCVPHNCEVGGAEKSRHLIGCAADIRPVDRAVIGPFKLLLKQMTDNLTGWEVRFYPTFVHVGVPREETARLWLGGSIAV